MKWLKNDDGKLNGDKLVSLILLIMLIVFMLSLMFISKSYENTSEIVRKKNTDIGSVAEWFSAILSGVAIIMVVWQVIYERKKTKEDNNLKETIEKQIGIIKKCEKLIGITVKYGAFITNNDNISKNDKISEILKREEILNIVLSIITDLQYINYLSTKSKLKNLILYPDAEINGLLKAIDGLSPEENDRYENLKKIQTDTHQLIKVSSDNIKAIFKLNSN